MMRSEPSRIDVRRRGHVDHKKRQFAQPEYGQSEYKYRLNFYQIPPTLDITLEEFEEWAIQRLKVLAELEACSFRNKTADETAEYMRNILDKHLPLPQGSARSTSSGDERRKDHYSHFILRLAFSSTDDLRKRFSRLETQLFRLRFADTHVRDRQDFVDSLNLDWQKVSDDERKSLNAELLAVTPASRKQDDEGWFKVDWEKVAELVESRRVFLKAGKAYVPAREQTSMVVADFTRRLDQALELTARALPRLDEDDRLTPILSHLSRHFTSPGSAFGESEELQGATITAGNIDQVSQHFPLCMRNLHMTLRKNNHLKHFGRLQYTLFLKGVGLSLEECLAFWRHSFKLITEEQFNKDYRYNVRHAYGDVGGDANRRGRGYTPYSCNKLCTEGLPGPGQTHGCPYRTHNVDNLIPLLQATGVQDKEVLNGVKADVQRKAYHIACNRVFEHAHKEELRQAKEQGTWSAADLDTIVHPNTYFKRSYLLKQGLPSARKEVAMEH